MKTLLILICSFGFALDACSQQDLDFLLIARNTGEKIIASDDTIRVFGFAQSLGEHPSIPGPTLEMNEGDSVHIDLWNVSQGAPHTIHLHGLDVDQQNDGVPHLSFDVHHMDHGYYHFKAPHAGTYLYHCHVASTIHVQAGMYGLIIIRPPNGGNTTWDGGHAYTNEHTFFLSEIDTSWHTDSVLLHDHDTTLTIHQVEIPDYNPQFFLVNGLSDQQLVNENTVFNSAVGQVDYTRLANIGFCGVRVIFPPELNAQIVASDGRPLPTEEISDTVYLFPGERFGVLTDPSSEFTGEITFDYIDMNTMQTKNTQVVPVIVSGFAGNDEVSISNDNVQISPNPFISKLEVEFELEYADAIGFQIVDFNGRIIEKVAPKNFEVGTHTVFLGQSLPSNCGYMLMMSGEKGIIHAETIIKL